MANMGTRFLFSPLQIHPLVGHFFNITPFLFERQGGPFQTHCVCGIYGRDDPCLHSLFRWLSAAPGGAKSGQVGPQSFALRFWIVFNKNGVQQFNICGKLLTFFVSDGPCFWRTRHDFFGSGPEAAQLHGEAAEVRRDAALFVALSGKDRGVLLLRVSHQWHLRHAKPTPGTVLTSLDSWPPWVRRWVWSYSIPTWKWDEELASHERDEDIGGYYWWLLVYVDIGDVTVAGQHALLLSSAAAVRARLDAKKWWSLQRSETIGSRAQILVTWRP